VSSEDRMVSQAADTKGIGMQAAAWIERRDFEQWNEADEAALKAWLEESPAHRIAFFRLDFSWQRTARLAALRSSNSTRTQALNKRRILSAIFRAAMIVAGVLALAGGGMLLFPQMNRTSYSTNIGAREILALKDGSQIELNTDTVLQVSKSGHQREVWLEKGEAYFQVAHDSVHPFIVRVGDRRITDIGTKFVVRRDDRKIRVAVLEGGVELKQTGAGDQSKSAVLRAGDVAVADANSFSVTKKSEFALTEELSWRNGVLVFDHTTLADAAFEINRYGGKKLIIADAAAGRIMIGGTFPINNVMAVAEAAQDSLGLHVEDRGDEIVISR
jgi:transmembrane sensor